MKSTREVLSNLVGTTKPHNMAYLGMKASRSAERVATSMDHLSCFYPGMLALGIMNGLLPESQAMARNLTHTCYYMYNITLPTHLAPEIFRFNNLPSKENDVLRSSVSLVVGFTKTKPSFILSPVAGIEISICLDLAFTVKPLSKGHFRTDILIKFKWFVPCMEVVLFKRFQSHYIDRGNKIWGFSFVHCGEVFNTVSLEGPL